ncbi:MAG: AarF/UbiB family protein [Myxococcota bacterium]
MLALRFLRASWVFGTIFASYFLHWLLTRVFRRWRADEYGRELPVDPPWLKRRKERLDSRNAKRVLRAILKLRGVYIKLGQVLSIMGGFLPMAYGKELESLQDAVPPRPFDVFRPLFDDGFGRQPEALYARIETQPIAAASLGQVHVAYDHDGTKLAVKVLYPGIRQQIRVDMKVIRASMKVLSWFLPVQGIERVNDALEDLLRRETDYRHEAACMQRVKAEFAHRPKVLVPDVVDELTTNDVLTMSFMEGARITDFEAYKKLGLDRETMARRLTECFYEQLFVHRFFHADPHPGNFLVDADDTLVILDYGAICEVEQKTIDGLLDVLRGFFEGRDELVLAGIEAIGFVAPDGDRELLERTVKTYFQKLLKVERTAGALMRATERELFELADPEVARLQLRDLMKSVNYPEGWFYVERASILMFWLVGQMAPDMDTLQVGMPYVLPLLAARTAAAPAPMSPTSSPVTT